MSQKPVLVLPGDGIGADFVRKAAELITVLAPDLEMIEAQYGRTSWEYTNDVLPPETEDAIADVDVVFAGPCDVTSLGKRDPLRTIINYNSVGMRAVEFCGLPRVCPNGIDACIATPVHTVTRQFKEMDSLDGVESTYFTVSEDAAHFFNDAVRLAKMRGRTCIKHVSAHEVFPHSSRTARGVFKEVMSGTDIEYELLDSSGGIEALTTKPTEAGMMIGGPVAALPLMGAAHGIAGGLGLMADTFLGDDLSVYTACIDMPEGRRENPTSTFLAAANLLLDLGYSKESEALKDAIRQMYHDKAGISKTNNMFDRSPDELVSGIVGIINNADEIDETSEDPVEGSS